MGKKIVLCKECKGTGIKISHEFRGYVERWVRIKNQCPACDGMGRMLRIKNVLYEKLTTNHLIQNLEY